MMVQQQMPQYDPVKAMPFFACWQRVRLLVFAFFVLLASVLAFPALCMSFLLWHSFGMEYDYEEYRQIVWTMATIGLLLYLCWVLLAAPFPWTFIVLRETLVSHLWQDAAMVLVWFWLVHLMLTPVFVLLLSCFTLSPFQVVLPTSQAGMNERKREKQKELACKCEKYAKQCAFADAKNRFGEKGMMLQQPPLRERPKSRSFQWRRPFVLPFFLLFVALFSLPGLLVVLVLWQVVKHSLDEWECQRWLYAGTILGMIFYLSWLVFAAPFPGVITLMITDVALGLWRDALMSLVLLWLTNMWLTPLFSLILITLAPPHASEPLPKEEPLMTVKEGRYEYEAWAGREVLPHFEPEGIKGGAFREKGTMNTLMPMPRFFLLFLWSWVLELFGGAALLRWYWGVAWLGGKESLAQLISDVLMVWNVTPASIILSVLGLYLLIHVAYAIWFGICGPYVTRWKLGVRPPSGREQERMRDALRVLTAGTGRAVFAPRKWGIAEGQGMYMRWIGYTLVIDRELMNHRYFLPLLAQELYSCNSEIRMERRFYEMLPKVQAAFGIFGGFPFAIGNALLYVFWMRYWHQCVFDADEYACDLGQGYALVQALDELYLKLDQATLGGRKLRKTPYIEERIHRLRGRLGI